MLKRITPFVLIVALVLVALPAASVQADALIEEVSVTCTSLSASGTTDAPYVVFEVGIWDDENETYDSVWEAIATPGGTFSHTMSIPSYPGDVYIDYWVYGSLSAGLDPDGGASYYAYRECTKDSGPTHPEDFVQTLFTCDTALYVEPDGAIIPDVLITAGQSWHIDPVGEEDEDGQMWHAVFVGSYDWPYVPATCLAK